MNQHLEAILILASFTTGIGTLLWGLASYSDRAHLRRCGSFAAAKQLSSGTRGNFAGELDGTPLTLRAFASWPGRDPKGQ